MFHTESHSPKKSKITYFSKKKKDLELYKFPVKLLCLRKTEPDYKSKRNKTDLNCSAKGSVYEFWVQFSTDPNPSNTSSKILWIPENDTRLSKGNFDKIFSDFITTCQEAQDTDNNEFYSKLSIFILFMCFHTAFLS